MVNIRVFVTNDRVSMLVRLLLNDEPKNRIAVIAFMAIMLAYSARKNIANGPAAYSTLNPETNSDSPSVKSNGARLVSARVEIYHIIASGHVVIISHMFSCVITSVFSVNEPLISMIDRRIMARVTSYEIVWATARRAPIRAYFEFEAHPDHKMEYTDRLDKDRISSKPRFRSISVLGIGSGVQIVRAIVRARMGAIMNIEIDEVNGRRGSLVNSFTASANGCRSPYGPTMFGPFRNCIYPSIFRSISVRNATARRMGIIYSSRFKKNIC